VSRIALWLTLLCAFVLAGCGGDEQPTSQEPAIARALAQDLSAQADTIAAAYESGDLCGAAQQADELVNDVAAAIESGDVPAALQDPLLGTAQKLQNDINCPQPEEKEEDDKEKGKDKGKGSGHEEETTTLDTTTTTTATTTTTTTATTTTGEGG
jgi:hypothetical protein